MNVLIRNVIKLEWNGWARIVFEKEGKRIELAINPRNVISIVNMDDDKTITISTASNDNLYLIICSDENEYHNLKSEVERVFIH